MTDTKAKSSRRSFFLHGGAALGAGVATTAGAKTLMAQPVPVLDDREAIRQLHLAFMDLMEQQAYDAAAALFQDAAQPNLSGLGASGQQQDTAVHTAYRQTPLQRKDLVTFSNDRQRAAATFHIEVQISTPLQGDCTAAQMARLQGHTVERRWESGRFDAQYVKVQGLWKVASLRYRAT
jgi:SnoaL-like domain